jgi:hypothetical protein
MKRADFSQALVFPGATRVQALFHALLCLNGAAAVAAYECGGDAAVDISVVVSAYRLHATRSKLLVSLWDSVTPGVRVTVFGPCIA